MAERVEHWFNRRYGVGRRDVYLLRTETGWQVLGRQGGADGQEVTHYFDREDGARRMLRRMLDAVPPELSDWAEMTLPKRSSAAFGAERPRDRSRSSPSSAGPNDL